MVNIVAVIQIIGGVGLFSLGIALLLLQEKAFKYLGVREDTVVATDSWFKIGNWYFLISLSIGLIAGGLGLAFMALPVR